MKLEEEEEEKLLKTVALENARSIMLARQEAEQDLLRTKEALEKKTLALEEETRILEVVNETGRGIASTLEFAALIQMVTDAATNVSGAAFGAFFYNMTDENGDAYQLYSLSGAPREAFEKLGHPRATPVFAPTFHGEAIVRSDDITHDSRYGQMAPHHGMPTGHLPVRSYLAVPVKSRSGETIGGLFFGHPERGVFTERSERLVSAVAAQAAIAIDNSRLYDRVKRAAEDHAQLFEAERAARSELERVSLVKDEFLATLSHELRTPLNAILGWAEMLLMHENAEGRIRQGLETITRNARAQAQMIEDLLDMNRIISGKVRLDIQRCELGKIVEAALESVAPSAAAKGIRLTKIIDPMAGPIAGDPNRLQQILWNLVSNAIKFTPKGGRVEVIVQRVSSHVEVTVNDNGVGINAEFLPFIFERFRQADSTTTRAYTGLGLGLSIVRHLVELHGGTVRAASSGEGSGSTFVVALPLQVVREDRDSSDPPPASGLPRDQVSLKGVKVLVVDDEPDARELLKHVLEASNAEVLTAGNADDGMDLVVRCRPDVIVSDIGMPKKDGYHFLREVRKLPASSGGKTVAIALTAFARSEDRTRAMFAGYQMHISKPVEALELIATIASLTGLTGA